MTAPAFGTFVAPELSGDQFSPKDNYNVPIIVKTKARKEGIVTANTPEGGPGVIVDMVNLATSEVLRDVLWMGGAIVDGLTPFVGGEVLVLKFEPKKSNTGRTYPVPVNAPEFHGNASAYYQQHGDPFAPVFGNIAPAAAPAPAVAPMAAPAPVATPAPVAAAAANVITAVQAAALQAANVDISAFTIQG